MVRAFRGISAPVVTKSKPCQHRARCSPAPTPSTVRSTSGGRSRRCHAVPAIPRSGCAAGRAWRATRTARRPGGGRARPRRATILRVEAWGPGAERGRGRRPGTARPRQRPGADPGWPSARRAARPPVTGRADPAIGGRPRVADPGHPRAEGHRPGGAPGVARAHPERTASRRPARPSGACASARRPRPSRRSPTTPTTRSAWNSVEPS